jgi:hypothetical protein
VQYPSGGTGMFKGGVKTAELLLAHRHHRHGAPPGTPEPGDVSPLLCTGVSSLYRGVISILRLQDRGAEAGLCPGQRKFPGAVETTGDAGDIAVSDRHGCLFAITASLGNSPGFARANRPILPKWLLRRVLPFAIRFAKVGNPRDSADPC